MVNSFNEGLFNVVILSCEKLVTSQKLCKVSYQQQEVIYGLSMSAKFLMTFNHHQGHFTYFTFQMQFLIQSCSN